MHTHACVHAHTYRDISKKIYIERGTSTPMPVCKQTHNGFKMTLLSRTAEGKACQGQRLTVCVKCPQWAFSRM